MFTTTVRGPPPYVVSIIIYYIVLLKFVLIYSVLCKLCDNDAAIELIAHARSTSTIAARCSRASICRMRVIIYLPSAPSLCPLRPFQWTNK